MYICILKIVCLVYKELIVEYLAIIVLSIFLLYFLFAWLQCLNSDVFNLFVLFSFKSFMFFLEFPHFVMCHSTKCKVKSV